MENKNNVTIYISSAFGVSQIEASLMDFGTKPYAQYPNAPFVHFVRKGKRKPEGFVKTSEPYIVILEGHGHIKPEDAYTSPVNIGSGMTSTQSRYSCFDERYKTEFDPKLSEYIKDKKVLMDIRSTVQTNVINK